MITPVTKTTFRYCGYEYPHKSGKFPTSGVKHAHFAQRKHQSEAV
jgi:hypothetical protein